MSLQPSWLSPANVVHVNVSAAFAGKLGQQWLDVGIYLNRHWRVKSIKTVS
jgi:hypothetical protein